MKRQLVLLILLFCSFSCASQKKEIIAKSTIKLEGKNTKIRDLMEVDGYYTDSRDEKCIDNVMFFEDGTYVWSFYFKEGVLTDSIKGDMSKNLKKWIEDKQIRWGSYWGVYRIEGDTIIGNYFVNGTFWRGWSFIEERYKIINKTTVKKIYRRSLLKSDNSYYELNSPWKNGWPYSFISADSLPSSDCWLKEEKWIWRNESDWKSYIEKIKQNKQK